jgi:hypothetical protein
VTSAAGVHVGREHYATPTAVGKKPNIGASLGDRRRTRSAAGPRRDSEQLAHHKPAGGELVVVAEPAVGMNQSSPWPRAMRLEDFFDTHDLGVRQRQRVRRNRWRDRPRDRAGRRRCRSRRRAAPGRAASSRRHLGALGLALHEARPELPCWWSCHIQRAPFSPDGVDRPDGRCRTSRPKPAGHRNPAFFNASIAP